MYTATRKRSTPLVFTIAAALLLVLGAPDRILAGPEEVARAMASIERGEKILDMSALDSAEKILLNECQGPQRDSLCEYYLARIYLAKYIYYYQVRGDNQKALQALSRAESTGKDAIARRPGDARVHVLMGRIHQVKLSRYSMSDLTRMMISDSPVVAEFNRALELDPGSGEAELGLGIYYLYIPRVFGGDGHRARTHFKKAHRLMPDNPEPAVWIAISYREEARLDDARQWLDRAKAIDPDNKFYQLEEQRLRAAEKAQGAR
jgi:tetratricopeptide (TPR) repeat protein